ncbi:MAG: GNAT family N-acetyltransferase [Clostridia bacterium]|nr:GNAT family N-acetyltransferase [Clostridia bacterium]
MLDKTLPYYNIIMKRYGGTAIPAYVLPDGYSFTSFREGDEKDWAEIMVSVGEFDDIQEARDYFEKEYLPYTRELQKRSFFIENQNSEKVGTLTNWWNYTDVRRDPSMHWVGVKPECQGLGLGKALILEGMKRMIAIEGDRDYFLHTQTWSYKAINIYIKAGYRIIKDEAFADYTNDYEKALEVIKDKLADQAILRRKVDFTVTEVCDPQTKSRYAEKVLRRLPEWFGNEKSLCEYVERVAELPFWAALNGSGECIGFLSVKIHYGHTGDIYVCGVLPEYHKKGVGKSLFSAADEYLIQQGCRYVIVQTLSETAHYEPYDKTRAFYLSIGFEPLITLTEMWDEENPCLIMIKSLNSKSN